MPDPSDPVTAGAALAASIGILIIAIAMDARKLPLGRIKYVPWTMLTLVMVLATALTARNLAIVLLQ